MLFFSLALMGQRKIIEDKKKNDAKIEKDDYAKPSPSPTAPDKNAEFEFERYLYLSLRKYPLFMYEEDSVKAENITLSQLSRETFEKMALKGCNCLNVHKNNLGGTLSEINDILSDAEKNETDLEKKALSKSFKKLIPFLDCFDTVSNFENDSSRLAVNTDLLRLAVDSDDDESIRIKQLEITYLYLGENCMNDRPLFLNFINTNKRIKEFIK